MRTKELFEEKASEMLMNLNEEDMVIILNQVGDTWVSPIEEFNRIFKDYEPFELADIVSNSNFDSNADWFTFDEGWQEIDTDLYIDGMLEEILEDVTERIEHDEDFGVDEVREFINEWQDELVNGFEEEEK